eukprot:2474695-Pleurochrysis_carterae.AAC.2
MGRVERIEGALSHVGVGYRSEITDGLNGGVRRFSEFIELAPLLRRYEAKQIGQIRRMDLHEADRPRSPRVVLLQVESRIVDGLHGRLNVDVGVRHGGELVELKSQVATCASAVHGKQQEEHEMNTQ